jgi:hypothetical protein
LMCERWAGAIAMQQKLAIPLIWHTSTNQYQAKAAFQDILINYFSNTWETYVVIYFIHQGNVSESMDSRMFVNDFRNHNLLAAKI